MINDVFVTEVKTYFKSNRNNRFQNHAKNCSSKILQNVKCFRKISYKAGDCGMVANVLDREFEHQSRYYTHFQTNTLEKYMNTIIHPAMD